MREGPPLLGGVKHGEARLWDPSRSSPPSQLACENRVSSPPSRLGRTRSASSARYGFDHETIGLAAVVAITFFNVSGGPWGSEGIFSAAGPLVGSVCIVLFTLFFCVPQCLVTAELCCLFPTNAGYAMWVKEAFGDFWGFQEVYWQWVSGVADSAVYPVLVVDTLIHVFSLSPSTEAVWAMRMATVTLLSLPSLISVRTVPGLLVAFAVATATPVLVFVVCGASVMDTGVLEEVSSGDIGHRGIGQFLNVLFWNFEGWDCISTVTAMIALPREKTLPRGLFIALALTCLQYLLVLAVAAGVSGPRDPWAAWKDGSLPRIAGSLGPGIGAAMLGASLVGNAGQYLSEFMEDSYLLSGAAEIGILPRVFAWRWRRSGAPVVANLVQLTMVAFIAVFDFSQILVFDNFFSGAAVVLQFAAFIALRWKRPHLRRPFRAPAAALVLFIPAVAFLGALLWHCVSEAREAAGVTALAFAIGLPYGLWVSASGKSTKLEQMLEED